MFVHTEICLDHFRDAGKNKGDLPPISRTVFGLILFAYTGYPRISLLLAFNSKNILGNSKKGQLLTLGSKEDFASPKNQVQ